MGPSTGPVPLLYLMTVLLMMMLLMHVCVTVHCCMLTGVHGIAELVVYTADTADYHDHTMLSVHHHQQQE